MECDKCKSKNIELIKREVKQKWVEYYLEFEDYEVVHFKCNECGCEFTECP